MKKIIYPLFLAITVSPALLLSYAGVSYADTLYLKNGDRITGEITGEDKDGVSIKSDAAGLIYIKRGFVKNVVADKPAKGPAPQEEKAAEWKRELSAGYDKSSGNTRQSALSARLHINRKTYSNESTIKADAFYSSANNKMDAQRWSGSARYAFSFWERRWYDFYKFEADHDRFANVDYRLIPSTGVGYWFSDTEEWKAMLEGGVGFEHTNYKNDTKTGNDAIFMPRVFVEKKLFGRSTLSQEATLYYKFEDFSDYRMRYETAFTNPISDKLSLRLSIIDNYDSTPAKDTKKNDFNFISSLVYSF